MYIYKRHMEEERQMQSSSPFICRQRGRTTPCNTLQLTAPYCETLQHATTRCNTHIHVHLCIHRSIYLYIYVYMCVCTYIYISFGYTEEKEGGTQRGVRETLTIEAMRHLMSHHMLQEEEEAGRGETEADGV